MLYFVVVCDRPVCEGSVLALVERETGDGKLLELKVKFHFFIR